MAIVAGFLAQVAAGEFMCLDSLDSLNSYLAIAIAIALAYI